MEKRLVALKISHHTKELQKNCWTTPKKSIHTHRPARKRAQRFVPCWDRNKNNNLQIRSNLGAKQNASICENYVTIKRCVVPTESAKNLNERKKHNDRMNKIKWKNIVNARSRLMASGSVFFLCWSKSKQLIANIVKNVQTKMLWNAFPLLFI